MTLTGATDAACDCSGLNTTVNVDNQAMVGPECSADEPKVPDQPVPDPGNQCPDVMDGRFGWEMICNPDGSTTINGEYQVDDEVTGDVDYIRVSKTFGPDVECLDMSFSGNDEWDGNADMCNFQSATLSLTPY
jgi:hypothetical protein